MKRQILAMVLALGGVGLVSSPVSGGGGQIEPRLSAASVLVDVSVDNGPVDVSGITIEVFSRTTGSMVASGSDPSEDRCDRSPRFDTPPCFLVELTPPDDAQGLYQLGAELPAGYVLSGVECSDFVPPPPDDFPGDFPGDFLDELEEDYEEVIDNLEDDADGLNERFEGMEGEFEIDGETPVSCLVTVEYVSQVVIADVVVVNDDGGTADGSTFMVEVFNEGGLLVDSKPDPGPNDPTASAEFLLPPGDYTFGVSGTDGYEVSAEVTVVVEQELAIIDDPSAEFSVTQDQSAAGVITADDIPAGETTSTAASTTAAPTIAVATTAVPTTQAPATQAAATTPPPTQPPLATSLPATGATSQTLPIMALALGLLALGAGVILATRRH
ncbi:MAG: LPXTG cell wall anchor domain-containing protein [Actinomycetota bacterium]